jgi:hypothetical protein
MLSLGAQRVHIFHPGTTWGLQWHYCIQRYASECGYLLCRAFSDCGTGTPKGTKEFCHDSNCKPLFVGVLLI